MPKQFNENKIKYSVDDGVMFENNFINVLIY